MLDDLDRYIDPALIKCACRRCSRGGRCNWMQSLYDLREAADQRAAITPDDHRWLTEKGWQR